MQMLWGGEMNELHKDSIYWTAKINHPVPINSGAAVSVKAETGRSINELLLIVDGKVYGCLSREK